MPRVGLAFALVLLAACRPGKGERCFCEGECRSGFVCAADGAVLAEGLCVNEASDSIESGTCIEEGQQQDGDDELNPRPVFDLGGWATDPAVTTSPGTSESMSSDSSSTMESSSGTSESMSSSSSSSSSSATETDAGTASSSGSTGPATGESM